MAGVWVADTLSRPVVERSKAVIRIVLPQHDLHLVIGVECRVVGQDVQTPAFTSVLPQLLCFDGHLAKSEARGVSDDPVLQPVFVAADRPQGCGQAGANDG